MINTHIQNPDRNFRKKKIAHLNGSVPEMNVWEEKEKEKSQRILDSFLLEENKDRKCFLSLFMCVPKAICTITFKGYWFSQLFLL